MAKREKFEGFHACGQFYRMGFTKGKPTYIEILQGLLREIRETALKTKSIT